MSASRIASRKFVGGAIGSVTGAAVSVPTNVTPYRKVLISAAAAGNPATLARHLNDIQLAAEEATAAARSNPEAGAVILGPYVGSGQLLNINHGLGRAPVSVTCARAIGTAWTGYEVAAATSGLDARLTVRIQMPASGTFYLRFA